MGTVPRLNPDGFAFCPVRQADGTLVLVWITASVWAFGYLQLNQGTDYTSIWEFASLQFMNMDFTSALQVFVTLQVSVVVAWELAMRYSGERPWRKGLPAVWLPRLIFFVSWTILTCLVILWFFEIKYVRREYGVSPFLASFLAMYAVGQILLYFWYRYKRQDLFMLSCGVFSACAVFVAISIIEMFGWSMINLLFLGLVVVGIATLGGKLLLFWKRAMEMEIPRGQRNRVTSEAVEDAPDSLRRDFFSFRCHGLDWEKLWSTLAKRGFWPADQEGPVPPLSGVPWYINTILSIGGWVSALFLIPFLQSLLIILDIRHPVGFPELVGGIVFLCIGRAFSRMPSFFARQFSLAIAIAGAVAVSVGLIWLSEAKTYWAFPCLLVCMVAFSVIPLRSYRYMMAVFGVFFLYILFNSLIWNGYIQSFSSSHHGIPVAIGVFLALPSVLLAWGWYTEQCWITHKRLAAAIPPLLHGMLTGLMLLLLNSLDPLPVPLYNLLLPRQIFGLGAACGCICLVFLLGRGRALINTERVTEKNTIVRLVCLVAALLTLPMGWFLPGLPLALLGFLIGRQSGNKVVFGASSLFLGIYIFYSYYNLESTLLYKSLHLSACGLTLLLTAALLRRFLINADNRDGNLNA